MNCGHLERVGGEGAVAGDERLGEGGAAAVPAGDGDVRVEGAALGLEAGGDAGALDLGGERRDRCLGLDPGPHRAAVAAVEAADPGDAQRERRGADPAERCGDIVGERAARPRR